MDIFEAHRNEQGEVVIGRKYHILNKIGNGCFGDVFLAKSLYSGREIAVKVEPQVEGRPQHLVHEYEMYRALRGGCGFPDIHAYRKEQSFHLMAMELLGPSLTDLQRKLKKSFSMKTVLMLADQILDRIHFVHRKGLIHRDIKPSNLMMGSAGRASRLFLADFGLAMRYLDPNGCHIPCTETTRMTGTVRYASLNAMRRMEQSRRDDLETVGYVLVQLAKGRLPWQGMKASNQAKMLQKVLLKKESVELDDLCAGLPEVFLDYLQYCRSLEFDQRPNYEYIRELFRKEFRDGGYSFDFQYDWVKMEHQLEEEKRKAAATKTNALRKRGQSQA